VLPKRALLLPEVSKQIAEFDLLRERVATLQRNVPRTQKQKSCCHTIIVMLVVDKHSIQTSKYYFNCAVTLPYGSNTLTIANAAIALLKNFMQVMSI
jgi:DNA polymerase V